MQLKKFKKSKGFTLVELLVVIAILAVLATVSIVGYTSFTKKAKVSNDVSLTTQMNTILQANEVVDGKNATPHEAVNELIDGGLDVTKLTPTANGYEYVWDSTQNRMILLDEDGKVVSPSDATISSKTDAFIFVDKKDDLSNEYSNYLKNDFAETEVEVSTGIDVGENENVTKVTYTNALAGRNVIIRTDGQDLVINDTTASEQHFYGYAKSANVTTGTSCFYAHGDVSSLELEEGKVVVKEEAIVYVSSVASGTVIEKQAETALVIVESGVIIPEDATVQQSSKAEVGNVLFAGGEGSESNPYQVTNREQMQNMSSIETFTYFKWTGSSTYDASDWSMVSFCGVFDGNNVTFNNLDNILFNQIIRCNGLSIENDNNIYEIRNLTINTNNNFYPNWNTGIIYYVPVYNFTMENVKVHGYIEGQTNVSSFIAFGPATKFDNSTGNFVFKNCYSDATIVTTSGCANGFFSHPYAMSNGAIKLINSSFSGTLYAPDLDSCKYVVGNWFNGTITDDATDTSSIYDRSKNGWKYIAEGKVNALTIETGTLPSKGNVFEVAAKENTAKATISLVVSPGSGSYTTTYLSETIDVKDGKVTSKNVKYYTIRVNASGVSETGIHGDYFDVYSKNYDSVIGSDTVVFITQYDAQGKIIAITNYSFGDTTK